MIDERFDHDSCGVGFVASVDARLPNHEILNQALTALSRLAHRGATAADGKSSDGVGVMTAIPRAFLVRTANLSIDDQQLLGVGMLLLPVDETRAEALLERCLISQDLEVLGWRDVPVCDWMAGRDGSGDDAADPAGAGGGCRGGPSRGRWNGGCISRGSSLSGRMRRAM